VFPLERAGSYLYDVVCHACPFTCQYFSLLIVDGCYTKQGGPHKKHRGKQLVRQGNIERDSNGAAADDEWLVNGLVSSRLKR